MKVFCKKDFLYEDSNGHDMFSAYSGNVYECWTNFGGLNVIVEDHDGNRFPFDPEEFLKRKTIPGPIRPYIYEYFISIEDHRENILNDIL